jgi:hypothetical protein
MVQSYRAALFSLDRIQFLVMWKPSGVPHATGPHLLDANMHACAGITARIVTILLPHTDTALRAVLHPLSDA